MRAVSVLFIITAGLNLYSDTINVLRLKGHSGTNIYSSVAENALQFGPENINYSQYTGTVTLSELNSRKPDILVISNPSGGNIAYSEDEKNAILDYLNQPNVGKGILGESYVFNSIGDTRPKMHFLGPVFGFREGIVYDNYEVSGKFYFLPEYESIDLFNGFTGSFQTSGFVRGNIPDGHGWTAYDLNKATVVASDADSTAIISVYDAEYYRAIYVSVWMAYQGSIDDQRMIYNCWRYIYHENDTFTIDTVTRPVLIPLTSPLQNRKPVFSWYSFDSADYYNIVIDTTGTFEHPVVFDSLQDTVFTPPDDLPFGNIHWMVIAHPGEIFSKKGQVYIQPDTIPFLERYNGAGIDDRRSYFKWNTVPGAGSYILQFDTLSFFAEPMQVIVLEDTSFQPIFMDCRSYYWRVSCDLNPIAFSPVDSLRIVGTLTATKPSYAGKKTITTVRGEVYNGMVRLLLPEFYHSADIRIVALDGRQVASFGSIRSKEVRWNTSKIQRGMYIVESRIDGDLCCSRITVIK